MGKKETQVGATESGIIVGKATGRKRHVPKITKRRAIIGLIIIAVLAVAAAGGLYWYHRHNVEQARVESRAAKFKAAKTDSDLAYSYAASGDYTTAQQIFDENIKSLSDSDKYSAYMTQASIALNAKKYDDATYYVQQAEKLDKTSTTASLLGDIALAKGDKTGARKYYETAKSRLNKNLRSYPTRLSAIEQQIEATK